MSRSTRSCRDEWERILLTKEEVQLRTRIRARKSYNYWVNMWNRLKHIRGTSARTKAIWVVYEAINENHGWGYRSLAGYAEQSLNLFLHDIKAQKEGTGFE